MHWVSQMQSLHLLIFSTVWLRISGQLTISSKLIIFVLFYYIFTYNVFFLNTRSLLVPEVSIESIEYIILLLLPLNEILLIFNTNLLFLCTNFNGFLLNYLYQVYFFYLVYLFFKLICFKVIIFAPSLSLINPTTSLFFL